MASQDNGEQVASAQAAANAESQEKDDARYTVESFDQMNLKEDLLRGVYAYGFEKPSFIQQQGILPLTAGRDTILQAQSGTGKTGTFSIAVLQLVDKARNVPQALLLSPTRELAQQTHAVLAAIGDYLRFKTHVCIGGTMVASDLQALRDGAQILVGTPGRICALIDKRQLSLEQMKIVILDEADELLNKGFVDAMRFVMRSVPSTTQLCLCSATLPQEVIELSSRFMRNPVQILVKTEDVTLDGITQYYVSVENQDKYATLCDIFDQLSLQQTIVYCNSRRNVEWLANSMTKDDHVVSCIHSDMEPATRTSIMQQFRTGKSRVLISTDLTARGIDVQTVSLVINFDIPRDKECYVHRIGRSGRHGRKGTAINFVSEAEAADMRVIEEFWKTHIEPLPADIANIKLV